MTFEEQAYNKIGVSSSDRIKRLSGRNFDYVGKHRRLIYTSS